MEGQTMTYKRITAILVLSVAALPLSSEMAQAPSKPSRSSQESKKTVASPQGEGERKFAQNCSRCHTAPHGFSPSISGTIVRHMRVRASLSKQDEEDILRFLNP
jgi:cytochrome c5